MTLNKGFKKRLEVTNLVDNNTGELLQSTSKSQGYESEPFFIKLYLDRLPEILGLPASGGRILMGLCKRMTFNTNEIILNAGIKGEICRELEIKTNTLDHHLVGFVKAGLMLRRGPGWYFVNPHYIAMGTWQNIREIRQKTVYNASGVWVEVEYDRIDAVEQNLDF